MPDAAGLRWSGAQQAMLRELGCELFVMRGTGEALAARAPVEDRPVIAVPARPPTFPPERAPAPAREPAPLSRAPRSTGAARARLVMLAPDANLLRGPDAAIARALLAALGVHEDEVRGEATAGMPAIAFGVPTDDDTVLRAPSLAALRNAHAKRALWPALRALRRRLRGPRGA